MMRYLLTDEFGEDVISILENIDCTEYYVGMAAVSYTHLSEKAYHKELPVCVYKLVKVLLTEGRKQKRYELARTNITSVSVSYTHL